VTDRGFYALDLAVTAGLAAAASLPLGLAWSRLRVGGIDPVYVREAQFIVGLLALLVATVASRPTRPTRSDRSGRDPDSAPADADPDLNPSRDADPDSDPGADPGADDGTGPAGRGDDPAPTATDGSRIPDDVVPPARLRVGLYGALTGRSPSPGDAPGPGAHAFAATAALFALSLGVELLV